MQADSIGEEEHLMCVNCEFEDKYVIYKIFVVSLIVYCYLQCSKMFSKYEQKCLIKIQISGGKNA